MEKRRVVLVTAFENVVVSQFIEQYQKLQNSSFEIQAVIQAEAPVSRTKKFYLRKLKKALRIGIFGVINGIRMRNWYQLPQGSLIKETCLKNHVPYYKVPLVNHPDTINLIHSLRSDLGISMGNSFISARVFNAFKEGMINTHGEVLPEYQNAQSVIWQIFNKSKITGFTIHEINEKIDQGAILYQEYIDIHFYNKISITVKNTNIVSAERSLSALLRVVENYNEYAAKAMPQGKGQHYTTPSLLQFWRMTQNNKKFFNENSLRK